MEEKMFATQVKDHISCREGWDHLIKTNDGDIIETVPSVRAQCVEMFTGYDPNAEPDDCDYEESIEDDDG